MATSTRPTRPQPAALSRCSATTRCSIAPRAAATRATLRSCGSAATTNTRSSPVLEDGHVATRIPVRDLDRARAFYSEKLGLEPAEERPGGLLYTPAGGGEFALFLSAGAPSGTHTQ